MDVSTHTTISNVDSAHSGPGVSTGDVSTIGGRTDPRSPMSLGQLGASTLSMRAKAARKRKVNAQHNSNFRAGYVPVEEDALHRTGIRGRKRYFLYCVLAILMIVAILNITVTAWLVYILGMTHYGLTSIELTTLRGRDFLRVLVDAQIITMSMNGASLGARHNSDIYLEATGSILEMKSGSGKTGSSVTLDGSNITLTTDTLYVKTRASKDWVSATLPSLTAHNTIANFMVDNVTASKVHGRKAYKDLYVESTAMDVNIFGREGVNVNSRNNIDIRGRSVLVDSQTSIILDGRHGIYFGTRLPKVTGTTSTPINPNLLTYKVCVCRSGQIFTVPVTRPGVSCDIGTQLRKICGNSL